MNRTQELTRYIFARADHVAEISQLVQNPKCVCVCVHIRTSVELRRGSWLACSELVQWYYWRVAIRDGLTGG